MKKLLEFTDKYGLMIILILVLFLFFRTCGMNVENKNYNTQLNERIDSLDNKFNNQMDSINYILKKSIIERQIEGLKTEKRMIQATNRSMLDVNRQNEIEKEIDKLNEKLNLIRNGK